MSQAFLELEYGSLDLSFGCSSPRASVPLKISLKLQMMKTVSQDMCGQR